MLRWIVLQALCPCIRFTGEGAPLNRGAKKKEYDSLYEGDFGSLHHVRDRASSVEFFRKVSRGIEFDGRLLEEAHLLEKVRPHAKEHHIVYLESLERGERPSLLLEYVSGEDLFSASGRQEQGLCFGQMRRVMKQVLDALAYLSALRIAHGSLSPATILIGSGWKATLIDFDLAFEGEKKSLCEGDVAYLSPEALVGGNINSSMDVWALGLTLLVSYTALDFFGDERVDQVIALHKEWLSGDPSPLYEEVMKVAQKKGECERIDELWDGAFFDMLEFDPKKRITAQQALTQLSPT